MRGSTPLDVAAASVMDNNELALSLRERELESVGVCRFVHSLHTNAFVFAVGYHPSGRVWLAELPVAVVQGVSRHWVESGGRGEIFGFLEERSVCKRSLSGLV